MRIHIDTQSLLGALLVRAFVFGVISIAALVFMPQRAATAEVDSFPMAEDREPVRTLWVVATAYSSDVYQTDDTPCIPANGYDLCKHYEKFGYGNTIAANFLPLETQVKLPELFGDQVFIVRDRMNERYGPGRIDVWMPTREEAKQFGVKYLQMEQFGGGKWRLRLANKQK